MILDGIDQLSNTCVFTIQDLGLIVGIAAVFCFIAGYAIGLLTLVIGRGITSKRRANETSRR